jgi:hypothetical protein
VTSYAVALPTVLCQTLNSGTELAVLVTNKWIMPALWQRLFFSRIWINETWQRRRLNYPLQIRVETSMQQNVSVNRQKVLVMTVYLSPNTPSDHWKSLIFPNLAGYSPKVCQIF